MPRRAQRSRARRAHGLYLVALLREFRASGLVLAALVLGGALLHRVTPLQSLGGARPSWGSAVYAAWIALLGNPTIGLGEPGYLLVIDAVFPLLGLVLVGEGLIRFGLLMLSRRRGEKEWMKVMASTFRNHVVLCGLGHLGYRILQELLASGFEVVAIERDPACRFLAQAKATGTPVLERDMTEDQALVEAGVEVARAIVVATNDDLGNLEVALDARRFNPGIRIVLRLFDQQIASKISQALTIDQAFSASALAAPAVAAMVMDARVLTTFKLDGVAHLVAEIEVGSDLPAGGEAPTSEEAVRLLHIRRGGALAGNVAAPLMAGDTVIASGAASAIRRYASRLRGER